MPLEDVLEKSSERLRETIARHSEEKRAKDELMKKSLVSDVFGSDDEDTEALAEKDQKKRKIDEVETKDLAGVSRSSSSSSDGAYYPDKVCKLTEEERKLHNLGLQVKSFFGFVPKTLKQRLDKVVQKAPRGQRMCRKKLPSAELRAKQLKSLQEDRDRVEQNYWIDIAKQVQAEALNLQKNTRWDPADLTSRLDAYQPTGIRNNSIHLGNRSQLRDQHKSYMKKQSAFRDIREKYWLEKAQESVKKWTRFLDHSDSESDESD